MDPQSMVGVQPLPDSKKHNCLPIVANDLLNEQGQLKLQSITDLAHLAWVFNRKKTVDDAEGVAMVQYFAQLQPLSALINWLLDARNSPNEMLTDTHYLLIFEFLNSAIELLAKSGQIQSQQTKKLRNIMAELFKVYTESYSQQIKREYLLLCVKMFIVTPQLVQMGRLLYYLQNFLSITSEFYELMSSILYSRRTLQEDIFASLFSGFLKRIQIYLNNKQSQQGTRVQTNRRHHKIVRAKVNEGIQIQNCFSMIIVWTGKDDCKSTKTLRLIQQKSFVESFLRYFYREKCGHSVSQLLQLIINSRIAPLTKFNCVLNQILKPILSNYSSLMARIDYSCLMAEGVEFISWFVDSQLTIDKSKSFLSYYTNDIYGIRLLMQVLVNYINDFPAQIQRIKTYLYRTDFISQIRFYLGDALIQQLLRLYYRLIDEEAIFEDIISSVQDITVRTMI